MNRFGLVLLGICGSFSAFAAPAKPVGQWIGRLHMVMPLGIPNNVRKDVEKRSASTMQSVFYLNLRADQTFSMFIKTGGHGPRPSPNLGSWSYTDKEVVLKSPKNSWHLSRLPGGKKLRKDLSKGGTGLYCDFTRT